MEPREPREILSNDKPSRPPAPILVMSSMGSCLLSLPFIFQAGNIWIQFILLIAIHFFNRFTLAAITNALYKKPQPSLAALSRHFIHPRSGVVLEVCYCLLFTGFLVVILIVVGSSTASLLQSWGVEKVSAAKVNVVVALLVLAPLSLARSLDFLNTVASFSILALAFVIIVILYRCIAAGFQGQLQTPATKISFSVICQTMVQYNGLYASHGALPVIFGSLRGNVASRASLLQRGLKYALVFITSCYAVVGWSGALLFGDNVLDNVLLNFPEDDPLIMLCQLLISCVVLVTYITVLFPTRANLLVLIHKQGSAAWFRGTSLSLVALSTFISVLVPSISTVLTFISSTLGYVIFWAIPYLFAIHPEVKSQRPHASSTEDLDHALLPTLAIITAQGRGNVTRLRAVSAVFPFLLPPSLRERAMSVQERPHRAMHMRTRAHSLDLVRRPSSFVLGRSRALDDEDKAADVNVPVSATVPLSTIPEEVERLPSHIPVDVDSPAPQTPIALAVEGEASSQLLKLRLRDWGVLVCMAGVNLVALVEAVRSMMS